MLSGDDKMSTSTVIGGKRDGTWDTCGSKTLGYCISCNRESRSMLEALLSAPSSFRR